MQSAIVQRNIQKIVSYSSKSFIKGDRTIYFYCLLHGDATEDPIALASCLTVLGKYHTHDTHSWEGDGNAISLGHQLYLW